MVSTTRQYYLLFPSEHWSPNKIQKSRFTLGFCSVSQNRYAAILLSTCYVYSSLSPKPFRWLCQLVYADTKRPRAGGGGSAVASKLQLRTGSAPSRHTAPGTGTELSHKQLSQKLWEAGKNGNRQLAHLGLISIGNKAEDGMETSRETLFYLISHIYMNVLMKRYNNDMNSISQQTGQTSTHTGKLGRTEKTDKTNISMDSWQPISVVTLTCSNTPSQFQHLQIVCF